MLLSVSNVDRPNNYKNLLTAAFILLSVFIITSNLTLMIATNRIKKKLTLFDGLFLFLSAVDLLIGVVVLPLEVYLAQKGGPPTCTEVVLKVLLNVFASTMSGLIISLITNDRFLLIVKKPFYNKFMTNMNVIFIIAILAIISMVWSFFAAYVSYESWDYGVVLFFLSYSIFATSFVLEVTLVNAALYSYLSKIPIIKEENIDAHIEQNRRRVSNTIIIISAVLVIAYTPICIGYLVVSASSLINKTPITQTSKYILVWISIPTVLNSGLNVSIYMGRNTYYVNYFRSVFTWKPKEQQGDF